jgi:hypothetical protein
VRNVCVHICGRAQNLIFVVDGKTVFGIMELLDFVQWASGSSD